jgi:endogenous inhibitor of DNA gyrase (YacG/DUF329 family)
MPTGVYQSTKRGKHKRKLGMPVFGQTQVAIECDDCGKPALLMRQSGQTPRWCSKRCGKRAWARRVTHSDQAARQGRDSAAEIIGMYQTWKKTDGKCHICGERVDLAIERPSEWGATLDRIDSSMPFVASNVLIAHHVCNGLKGSKHIASVVTAVVTEKQGTLF